MPSNDSSEQRTEFTIISSDDKLILNSVEYYNKYYHTDFKVERFINDEVVFAVISASKFELSDVFSLGYQFGAIAENKRQKGEIDW
ncbi:hypothetical protein GVN16_21795 [Emticicia sp. CRIBPO]|uniref:hypothetical protein n=1 Tax=Emticicia sp. CRIBPO TaxID=2683258 RepID=UPI001412830E|nr:hypothetical protein [Emticicia sp. CRIBPO]NBA88422.1 hypothetical protein [Emticicia sp. CRIBPO]